jgi:hypothetical protein
MLSSPARLRRTAISAQKVGSPDFFVLVPETPHDFLWNFKIDESLGCVVSEFLFVGFRAIEMPTRFPKVIVDSPSGDKTLAARKYSGERSCLPPALVFALVL